MNKVYTPLKKKENSRPVKELLSKYLTFGKYDQRKSDMIALEYKALAEKRRLERRDSRINSKLNQENLINSFSNLIEKQLNKF